ncbi:MAG: glutamate--cysteine ligase [Gammaproteobacteria bacterium]|nr:MAG: glutamate--cysteine ligase [Gammaproteobacteria bacterium]
MSKNRIAEERLQKLLEGNPEIFARGSLIGIEKESLRVTAEGDIAQTPHPRALGSALTHRYITTDFSEALLEFITPPCADVRDTLECMNDVHRFVYANLDRDELLWTSSMPCKVAGDASVRLAEYGSSNVGTMKNVYRRGLGYRYGRLMQAIAGVHFNYSFSPELWPVFQTLLGNRDGLQRFISDSYFALIRNFQRQGWLVPYLFGSSPVVCKSFLGAKADGFRDLDGGSWYQPYATTLRMSDIGYKNKSQASLRISYDNVDAYIESLTRAIETPNPEYQAIGVVVDGEYRQLNANILQIENEYYSFIRPKRVARSGEKPTVALAERGVEYVEVRALDVSAFDPSGVNEDQMRFLEALLVFCVLRQSDPISDQDRLDIEHNQQAVATRGRQPGLTLRRHGRDVELRQWAQEICTAMQGICTLLDAGDAHGAYSQALERQREGIADPECLPSARMLAEMAASDESFFQYSMRLSREHRDFFVDAPLTDAQRERFEAEASRSLAEQRDIEASDNSSFAEYLESYFRQTAIDSKKLSA